MASRFFKRGLAFAARRLERPELFSAFDRPARQAEREEVGIAAALASVLRSDSTYVDVGANRGQVLREAVRIAPHGRHVAFEPIPALAQELARAFPGVDCRASALAAEPGKAEFTYFHALDGWSGLRRNPEISDERGRPELIEVEVSTLDAELDGLAPAAIKVDVEGAEVAVLRGGREVFARSRPLLILEHVAETAGLYGSSSEELWRLLDEMGYVVFTATGEGPVEGDELGRLGQVVNWLARPAGDEAARGTSG
jgi:FkbM family methyltransferase